MRTFSENKNEPIDDSGELLRDLMFLGAVALGVVAVMVGCAALAMAVFQ